MKRVIYTLALLSALASCNTKSDEQKSADALEIKVADKMKDPESTKFRDLKFGAGSLCGEVNAKNSFGAYTGYEKFSAIGSIVQLRNEIEAIDGAVGGGPKVFDGRTVLEEFDRQWSECHTKGVAVE